MNIKKLPSKKVFFELEVFVFRPRIYVFACTCKNTNPNANPKSVIPTQIIAVVTISPIFLMFDL